MKARHILTMALAFAVSLAGRQGFAEQGVTDTEVVIGTTTPLSGPAAAWGNTARGAEAYIKLINDAGGIHGRKIKLVVRDDGYQPPRALANAKELMEGVEVFAMEGVLGTACVLAARDSIIEKNIPWISPIADSRIWVGYGKPLKNAFVVYPDYISEGKVLAKYAIDELKKKKIAVFYQNDPYGKTGLEGLRLGAKEAKKKGKIISEVPYEIAVTDLSSHAMELKKSKADVLILFASPKHAAMILKETGKLGYKPAVLSSFTLADPVMFQLAGDAWEGVIASAYFPTIGMDEKVDGTFKKIAQVNPDLAKTPFIALAGITFVEPLIEGLRRAGKDLTREKLVSAMESIRNWDGDVIRGVSFGEKRRQGINRIYLLRMEKGTQVKVSDWIEYPVEF